MSAGMCWARSELRYLPELARDLACVVVSVEYRLAPETLYSGSVEDHYAALKWMHGAAAELRLDPARIALLGESAGGTHAALLAIAARDRGARCRWPSRRWSTRCSTMPPAARACQCRGSARCCGMRTTPLRLAFVPRRGTWRAGRACRRGTRAGDGSLGSAAHVDRPGGANLFVEEDSENATRLPRAAWRPNCWQCPAPSIPLTASCRMPRRRAASPGPGWPRCAALSPGRLAETQPATPAACTSLVATL